METRLRAMAGVAAALILGGCAPKQVAIYPPPGVYGRVAPDLGAEPTTQLKADDRLSCGEVGGAGARILHLKAKAPTPFEMEMAETPGEGRFFERSLTMVLDGVPFTKGPTSTVTFEVTRGRVHGAILGAMLGPKGERVSVSIEFNVPMCTPSK